jgi:hypothetical protein
MLTRKFLLPKESPGRPLALEEYRVPDFVIANFLAGSVKYALLNKLHFGFAL